jgi:hypothetical protein
VDKGATNKEEAQRGSRPKKKCLSNSESIKKAEDNVDLNEHGKRISE